MGMIFISAIKKDQIYADRLMHILMKKGLRVWTGEYDAPPSNDYKGVIVDTIERCSSFIAVLSNEAFLEPWALEELKIAVENGKKVFPIAIEGIRSTPSFASYLEGSEIISLKKDFDGDNFDVLKLAESLKAIEGKKEPVKEAEKVEKSEEAKQNDDLGKDFNGRVSINFGTKDDGTDLVEDVSQLPHLLIGGARGMGKTDFLWSIILDAIKNHTPSEVKLVVIDLKRVEFNELENTPYLFESPAINRKSVNGIFKRLQDEMERRFSILVENRAKNVDEYNQGSGEKLPKILVIVDELCETLSNDEDGEYCLKIISCLAQKSRAVGIHLILASQRPDVSSLPGALRANLPARLCFKTANENDSHLVLGNSLAARLEKRGEAYYLSPSSLEPVKVQTKYSSADKYFLNFMSFAEFNGKNSGKEMSYGLKEDEFEIKELELIKEVLRLMIKTRTRSISKIQREFSISYPRARKIVEYLKKKGYISETIEGAGDEILITKEDFERIFNEPFDE